MGSTGLILDGIAAIMIAYGQWQLGKITKLSLDSLGTNLQLVAQGKLESCDFAISARIDPHWERVAIRSRIVGMLGWILFVIGIGLQAVAEMK